MVLIEAIPVGACCGHVPASIDDAPRQIASACEQLTQPIKKLLVGTHAEHGGHDKPLRRSFSMQRSH